MRAQLHSQRVRLLLRQVACTHTARAARARNGDAERPHSSTALTPSRVVRPPAPQERAREQLPAGGGASCAASGTCAASAANASSLPATACALLCPIGAATFAATGAGAEADSSPDDASAGGEAFGIASSRIAAAAFVAVLLAAPWCGVSYLHTVPFGHRHSPPVRGGADGAADASHPHPHSGLPRHTLLHVLSYRLDQFFSTNAASKPLALLALTAMLVLCGSVALFAVSGDDPSTLVWASLAGVGLDWTFAGEEGTTAAHRIVALLLSVGGMLVTALLLGIVSDTIGAKMDDLRRGRSDVLETGHTLILGWSDKLLPIIRQLALANESEGGGVVVILAERDKEEMDEQVSTYLQDHDAAGTKIVCRTGSPLLTSDLAKVSAASARAVVVLAECAAGGADAADGADATTLRVVLSLCHMRDHGGGLAGHIVAEVCDIDNEPLMGLVGGAGLHTVVSHDVIGRIMLQCARQPGLAFVFEDLLGFDGAEFYKQEWPALTGRCFADVAFMFAEAIPIGVVQPCGAVLLNPADDYELCDGDALLVVAEDDDSYSPSAAPAVLSAAAAQPPPPRAETSRPEKILFVGWRRDLQDLVTALDEFAPPGSQLWLFSEVPQAERLTRFAADGLDVATDLKCLTLMHAVGDPVSRKDLEALPLETFDSVLILAHASGPDDTSSTMDSKSLATLLLVRDIQAQRLTSGNDAAALPTPRGSPSSARAGSWVDGMRGAASRRCTVISEILDTRTRHLVAETGICNYVLSNELISNALAMVSEDPHINVVLRELFTAEGQELYVLPASTLVAPGEELSFWDVAARARTRRQVLIGAAPPPVPRGQGGAVLQRSSSCSFAMPMARRAVLNPSDKAAPRLWRPDDLLVVMSE
jgi:hypothetical protein